MVYNFHLAFFITASLLCVGIMCQGCSLNIGQNLIAAYAGRGIFHNGEVDERWKENSLDPYITPLNMDIEFFYSMEVHHSIYTQSHQSIKATLSSGDVSIANPNLIVSQTDKTTDTIDTVSIEIRYGCQPNKKGKVKMTLSVTPDHCAPFTLTWFKICKPKGHLPSINLGLSDKGTDLIKEGRLQEHLQVFDPNDERKLTFGKDKAHFYLYISRSKEGKSLVMKTPEIIYDSNCFTPHIFGSLQKGGVISNIPTQIHFVLECALLKQSVSDFEINLPFENDDIVSLYFKKECESAGEAQDYFNFFYTLYWIFLILIALFLMSVVYFYLQRNDISLKGLYERTIDQFKRWLRKRTHKNEDLALNTPSETYGENDLVSVKIKTESKPVSTELHFNKFTSEYGGI